MSPRRVEDDPEFPDRFIVVNGRRWRRADPLIPEAERAELLSHLGRGRSGVRTAGSDQEVALCRRRTDLAKHGLGERGDPWWEQDEAEREQRWTVALRDLAALDERS